MVVALWDYPAVSWLKSRKFQITSRVGSFVKIFTIGDNLSVEDNYKPVVGTREISRYYTEIVVLQGRPQCSVTG